MSVEVSQVDIVVSVYVDFGAVYDDASEVVDNGNWPTRKEVVDKTVVNDKAVAIGMTRKKAQECVGKFHHKEKNGRARGARINGVKYNFVEPEGPLGRGYFLEWAAWEQAQRGDFEVKTEVEINGSLHTVNGKNGFGLVVDETSELVYTVNGVVTKALLKEARKVYFEKVKPVFDRLRVLRGRDRSCYSIFAPGFARDREDLKRECEVLFGLKSSDNADDLRNIYKESKEHYNTQIQPYLNTLERILGCDRVTFAPGIIASLAIVLDREIKDFFKLLDSVVEEK